MIDSMLVGWQRKKNAGKTQDTEIYLHADLCRKGILLLEDEQQQYNADCNGWESSSTSDCRLFHMFLCWSLGIGIARTLASILILLLAWMSAQSTQMECHFQQMNGPKYSILIIECYSQRRMNICQGSFEEKFSSGDPDDRHVIWWCLAPLKKKPWGLAAPASNLT